MPQVKSRRAHDLFERPMIEMFFIDFKQCGAINFFQHGNAADNGNLAVVFDGAAIFEIFLANQRHAADRKARCSTQRRSVSSV